MTTGRINQVTTIRDEIHSSQEALKHTHRSRIISSRMRAKSFFSVYIHTRQTSSVDDIAWQLSFPRLTEMLGFSAVPAGVSLPARPVTPSR